MQPDVQLEQLRLIDDLLEGDNDSVTDDAFADEIERAVWIVRLSKIRDRLGMMDRERSDPWIISLRNAGLRAEKSDTL